MVRAEVPLREKAEAARRALAAAGPRDDAAEARRRARERGSLMTPGQVAEWLGDETVELAVVTYRFSAGCGRCDPPVDVVVRCLPVALEGVYRSVAKLNESRGWASEARVSRERVPRAEVAAFLAERGES